MPTVSHFSDLHRSTAEETTGRGGRSGWTEHFSGDEEAGLRCLLLNDAFVAASRYGPALANYL